MIQRESKNQANEILKIKNIVVKLAKKLEVEIADDE